MAHSQLDDMVLLRSDGSPTYMLAVVADDHDMGITHILRGDDHLNNAFRQQQIYLALGWPVPVFGHMPLIHGADGTKLSKRHGALGVDAWRDMGFLPEALLNYLARLGWSHGDDELFSMAEALSWFDGSQLGKSAARFDTDKLRAVNAHWMRQHSPAELADWVLERAQASAPAARDRLVGLISQLAERAHTLEELAAASGWLLHDGAPQPDEGAAQLLDEAACARLKKLAEALPDELGGCRGPASLAARLAGRNGSENEGYWPAAARRSDRQQIRPLPHRYSDCAGQGRDREPHRTDLQLDIHSDYNAALY